MINSINGTGFCYEIADKPFRLYSMGDASSLIIMLILGIGLGIFIKFLFEPPR